ncbi:MAG TPA: type II secretion system F family protein [Isosphaeraceae bacterium]|nr:type II secretion system F family protein [Isosphaeraceae bacterium]
MKTETYRYSALDETGNQISGTEAATSASAAHLALLERGYQPLELKEKKSVLQFEVTKKKVPRKELMHFSRQLSVFVEAGIPIMEALEVIAEEESNKLFKSVIADIIDKLQSGDTFAAAAAMHPEAFPRYYIAVLESAELTGTLDVVLRELADYIERDVEARGKLINALIYPAVVFVLTIAVVIVLCAFVLPKFKTFFDSLNAKLPLPTRMLLAFSNFMSHWWWLILALLVLAVVGLIAMRRTAGGRAWLDSVILRIPVAGGVVQAAIVERVCRVLQSLVTAGVDLPRAMAVTADSANNAVYSKSLTYVREAMMEGNGLAGPLAETGVFPAAAQQMFRVGEETGTLDKQLGTAARYYNRELDTRLKHFTSLFEPIIIILMGAIVGFVAIALVSAMYGIYRQVHV